MTEYSMDVRLFFRLILLAGSSLATATASATAPPLSAVSFANASLATAAAAATVALVSSDPSPSVGGVSGGDGGGGFGGGGFGGGGVEGDEDPCLALQRRRAEDYGGARSIMLSRPSSWAFLVVFSVAALVGVVGNALSIYIYVFRVKRTPTTVFIVMLAVVDLAVCLLVVPQRFTSLLLVPLGSDALCKGGEFLFFLALPMSCFILLAIAVERFVTICLSKVNWLTPAAMRAALVAIFIVSAAIASPSLLTVTVYSRVPAATPPVVCNVGLCKPTYEYVSQQADWSYWLLLAAIFAVMAIAIIVMYATIFARVMAARSRLSRWKPGGGRDCACCFGTASARRRGGGRALGSVAAAAAAAATGATAERRAFAVAANDRAECSADAPRRTESMELSETTANGSGGGGGSRAALSTSLTYDNVPKAVGGTTRRGAGGGGGCGCRASDDLDAESASNRTRLQANEPDVVPVAVDCGGKSASSLDSSSATAARQPRMQRRRSQLSTAAGLCTVTGAFIVAYTPVFVMSLTGVCDHGGGAPGSGADDCEWPSTWSVLWHFFLLNHAANPIIYAFMNTRFKEALRAMIYGGGGGTDGAGRRRRGCK